MCNILLRLQRPLTFLPFVLQTNTRTLELYKEFQEEAYSVALHPTGLFVLVGFSDKLRLMNLLMDDIRTAREFPIRGCRGVSLSCALTYGGVHVAALHRVQTVVVAQCAFSNGGHMFAAVNGNVVQIYALMSLENILNLKGHKGKVRASH